MRLLIIADIYPSREDPTSGVFIREQVEQLYKYHDICVMVIGRRFVRVGIRSFLKYILDIFRMPSERMREKRIAGNKTEKKERNIIRIEYPVFVHILNGLSVYITAVKKLNKADFQPDLIYAHKSFPAGYVGWKLKKQYKAPVVTMEFQGPFSSYFNEPYLGGRVINTINHIDRTIHSGFQLKEIQAYGIKGDRLGVAYYGIDTDRFSFDKEGYNYRKKEIKDGKIKLLVVGRIEEEKGIGYLLEAVQLLKKEYPYVYLSMIGPIGKGGIKILDSIITKNLEDNAQYKGICKNEELSLVINNHDILVSASLHETFGVTIVEAMACGKPVVATRCGGPEETVTEKVGILVEKADPEALADGIRYVIKNYESYNPEEIREYVMKNFSHEVVIKKLNKLFDELLRDKK